MDVDIKLERGGIEIAEPRHELPFGRSKPAKFRVLRERCGRPERVRLSNECSQANEKITLKRGELLRRCCPFWPRELRGGRLFRRQGRDRSVIKARLGYALVHCQEIVELPNGLPQPLRCRGKSGLSIGGDVGGAFFEGILRRSGSARRLHGRPRPAGEVRA